MDEELNALMVLNEDDQLRGRKLTKLYQKTGSFSQILRAYNQKVNLDKISVQYEENGIGRLPFWDKNYPTLLKEIEGKPLLLYVKGNIEIFSKPMVAAVGSRSMSNQAKNKTQIVVRELVNQGKVIVSGLAKGIDTVAHQTAIDCGGKTIAVLAHGLEKIYPSENRKLAAEIVKSGGVVISEQPLNAQIERRYFLERNRIIVGMSEALVVIEADLQSGSLASANWAAEMGREVLAVPGSAGTDLLIEEGAIKIPYKDGP